MENQNGDTLPEDKEQKPAASQETTPPNAEGSPDPEDLKNQVEREKSRAATAMREKEEVERQLRIEKRERARAEARAKAPRGKDSDDGGDAPNNAPTGDHEARIVRAEAERGVFAALSMSSEYQKLLVADPTLRDVLTNNPLSIIREYADAEDAVEQVKDYLDKRVRDKAAAEKPADNNQNQNRNIQPPSGKVEMTGKYTPQQVAQMTPEEWGKLPKEERQRLKAGKF